MVELQLWLPDIMSTFGFVSISISCGISVWAHSVVEFFTLKLCDWTSLRLKLPCFDCSSREDTLGALVYRW